MKNITILLAFVFALTCMSGFAGECIREKSECVVSELNSALVDLNDIQDVNLKEKYRLTKCLKVAYGKIYKFQQCKDGMDVLGKEIIITTNTEGKILSVSGHYLPIQTLPKAVLSQTDIVDIIAKRKGTNVSVVDKIIYPMETGAEIAYKAVCMDEAMQYIISATDGKILRSCPVNRNNAILMMPQKDADGNTVIADIEYDGASYMLSDYTRNIFTLNAHGDEESGLVEYYQNNTGVFEPIAVSAYTNVVKAYDFYADEKNIGVSLRGVNGGNDDIWGNVMNRSEEIPIMIYVHYGNQYENAHCGYDTNSGYVNMLIGDGKSDGVLYQPARAADVIGHEYQHAVTAFAANFTYMNDSGALNEAFSDIFGMLVEGHDPDEEDFWRIGENAVTNGTELRSVKGGTKGQRYHAKNKIQNCKLNHDHIYCNYGGTHQNSTIISHVQYLLSEARPDFFTREKIGHLWYSTLCALGSEATFDDFGRQFYQSAVNLGFEEEICQLVYECLNEIGLLSRYTVKFVDNDGSLIYETQVFSGESANCPEMPQQKQTQQYILEFKGWSEVPENITHNMTIKAQYKLTRRLYTVTFYDMDENVLTRKDYGFGDKINPPSLSEMESPYVSDDYIFNGWYLDKDFTEPVNYSDTVEGETILYGKWTKKPQEPPIEEKPEIIPKDTSDITWLYISLGVACIITSVVAAIIVKKQKYNSR